MTSEITQVCYKGAMAQLSKRWVLRDDEQFFPLAAFYEELIDRRGRADDVRFDYNSFVEIMREKCKDVKGGEGRDEARFDDNMCTFWKVFIIDYLLCNVRSAGNTGFVKGDEWQLSANYDNSTVLHSVNDLRFIDLDFPQVSMKFYKAKNAAYYILTYLDDPHLDKALHHARAQINLASLHATIMAAEDSYLYDVVEYRYKKLFENENYLH